MSVGTARLVDGVDIRDHPAGRPYAYRPGVAEHPGGQAHLAIARVVNPAVIHRDIVASPRSEGPQISLSRSHTATASASRAYAGPLRDHRVSAGQSGADDGNRTRVFSLGSYFRRSAALAETAVRGVLGCSKSVIYQQHWYVRRPSQVRRRYGVGTAEVRWRWRYGRGTECAGSRSAHPPFLKSAQCRFESDWGHGI